VKRKSILAVVAAAFMSSAAIAAPLKIATIEAMSGPAASTSVAFLEGLRYGVMKLNDAGGFNGEKIELLEFDSLGSTTTASEKLKVAIAAGAQVVSSAGSSAVAAQLSEDVRKYNLRNPGKEIVYWNIGSEAAELTGEKCHFWFFRMSTNPFVRINALVPVMKETGALGDKVYSINQNYSYGQEHERAQAAAVAKAGSKVVEATLHDTNKIQDFSPYVAKVKASGATSVLTGNWANDIALLLRAAGDAGLKVRFGNTSLDTPGVLANAGDAALGAYLVKIYNLEAGGEKGRAFIEDFKVKMGHYPYSEEPTSAFATMHLGAALKTLDFKGGPIVPLKLALAIEGATWESPTGTWSVRKEDHQAVMPITVSEVSKAAKFKVDGTDRGFKLIKVVAPKVAEAAPTGSCNMKRP